MTNQFSRMNRLVKCCVCGKLTNSEINGQIGIELCRKCNDEALMENEHSDGYHETNSREDCADCQKAKVGNQTETR